MANETTTTTANDIYFAAWVGDTVLDEMRPYMVGKELLKYEGRRPSKAFDFPIQADPGAAASNQTEGTAFANTALSTDKATATARLNGQVATVTDFVDAVALVDAVSHFSQVIGRSLAEEYNVTINAQWDNFSNATTASTVLLVSDFQKAIGALEARDAVGDLVAVLHPKQVSDLRQAIDVTANALFRGSPTFGEAIGGASSGAVSARARAEVGNILGVDTYMTSSVPTSIDLKGGMFVRGVSNGIYEVWGPRIETHRDAFQPGTQIAGTSVYGVAEIRDEWGQEIASDP